MLPASILDAVPRGGRVVEVGVGGRFDLVEALASARRDLDLVVTDVDPAAVRGAPSGVRAVVDDVVDPRRDVYAGAVLIVARRPGEEVQPALARLARAAGCVLAIAPLADELVDLRPWLQAVRVERGPTGRVWHVFEPRRDSLA